MIHTQTLQQKKLLRMCCCCCCIPGTAHPVGVLAERVDKALPVNTPHFDRLVVWGCHQSVAIMGEGNTAYSGRVSFEHWRLALSTVHRYITKKKTTDLNRCLSKSHMPCSLSFQIKLSSFKEKWLELTLKVSTVGQFYLWRKWPPGYQTGRTARQWWRLGGQQSGKLLPLEQDSKSSGSYPLTLRLEGDKREVNEENLT